MILKMRKCGRKLVLIDLRSFPHAVLRETSIPSFQLRPTQQPKRSLAHTFLAALPIKSGVSSIS